MSFDARLKEIIDDFTQEILEAVSNSTLQEILELTSETEPFEEPVRKKRKYTKRKKIAAKARTVEESRVPKDEKVESSLEEEVAVPAQEAPDEAKASVDENAAVAAPQASGEAVVESAVVSTESDSEDSQAHERIVVDESVSQVVMSDSKMPSGE